MTAIPEDLLRKARAKARREFDRLRQTPEYEYAHDSHAARKALELVEPIVNADGLRTFGVEGFAEHGGCTYLNTGDSYGRTILYRKGRFQIGAWGDIVERYC